MTVKKDIVFWSSSVIIAIAALSVLIIFTFRSEPARRDGIKQIYYADNISAAHRTIITKFNKLHQGKIEVLPVNLPFSKFNTNVKKEILTRVLRSSSDQIDIFAVDLIWVSRFAKWGLPLDSYISRDELDRIEPFVLESCYNNNHLMAMPLYVDVGLLYYRRDIIDALPDGRDIEKKLQQSITWRAFIRLGQRLAHLNMAFFLFPGDSFEGFLCSFLETMEKQTVDRIFSAKDIDLNVQESRKGLALFVDLINRYKLSPSFVVGADEYENSMYALQNDAVFIRGWPGFIKQHRQTVADTNKIDLFEIAPLPHFKNQQKTGVYGGWNLMVSKYSQKQKEAVLFLQFIQKEENQKLLYEQSGYLPTNRSVYQDSTFLAKNPRLKRYWHILKMGKHRPYRKDYTRISDILTYYMNLALRKKIPVDKALEQASKQINSKKVFIKK